MMRLTAVAALGTWFVIGTAVLLMDTGLARRIIKIRLFSMRVPPFYRHGRVYLVGVAAGDYQKTDWEPAGSPAAD